MAHPYSVLNDGVASDGYPISNGAVLADEHTMPQSHLGTELRSTIYNAVAPDHAIRAHDDRKEAVTSVHTNQ
jgi:hypothetical protein